MMIDTGMENRHNLQHDQGLTDHPEKQQVFRDKHFYCVSGQIKLATS